MIEKLSNSWQEIIYSALDELDSEYLKFLKEDNSYFLNAFKTLSLEDTKYILFGQDPYPRKESAIGYAFIDGKVKEIFSKNGFSKEVNRATSLRNFIKTLLVCDKKLDDDLSQNAISKIDKTPYIKTLHDLRVNFEKNGVLLLNTALVFTTKEESKKHIKEWRAFVNKLLECLKSHDIELILFGIAAKDLQKFQVVQRYKKHILPHPYNISFIKDKNAHELFGKMRLLHKE